MTTYTAVPHLDPTLPGDLLEMSLSYDFTVPQEHHDLDLCHQEGPE